MADGDAVSIFHPSTFPFVVDFSDFFHVHLVYLIHQKITNPNKNEK